MHDLFRCNHGYIQPFCSPDPLAIIKGEISPNQLNANVSTWSETWGYETCSSNDERYVFSKVKIFKSCILFIHFYIRLVLVD
jgi:hypothetical protein